MANSNKCESETPVSTFGRIGNALGVCFGTFFTILLATGIRGDWLLIYVQLKTLWGGNATLTSSVGKDILDHNENGTSHDHFTPEAYYMKDIGFYLVLSNFGAFLIFWGVGGWLHWYYYIQRRERAEDWKCQPEIFLSPKDGRLEFWLGTFNMAIGSVLSGLLVTYIMNGGRTNFYYSIWDYGLPYLLASIPANYVYNEASQYYAHRMMHHPIFYKRYHKLHHRFKCPTPWSAAAMHPYEFIIFQSLLLLPMFVVPLHAGVFLFWLVYDLYYGILDHSGIDLHSMLPWQPSVMFHDDHHKYFHCNFGVNATFFDKFHGTFRMPGRFYSETTFGGKGAPSYDSAELKDGKVS